MTAIALPESPTQGMTQIEETIFHRARRAERFATAFGGFFWSGNTREITDEQWFDASEALEVLMPSPETRAATMALLDVEQGYLDLEAPEGSRDTARVYYTLRKAARVAKPLMDAGVMDASEITPMMWREARIRAGLSSNEAPSNITRAAIAGIIYQRMTW